METKIREPTEDLVIILLCFYSKGCINLSQYMPLRRP